MREPVAPPAFRVSTGRPLTLLLLTIISLGPVGAASGEGDLDGRTLLSRMARAYSGCRSYTDTGTVTTVLAAGGRSWAEERTFRTAFVRSGPFRFEFTDRGTRHILWRAGSEVRMWWGAGSRVEAATSLNDAIAEATGVSGRTALTIPLLLMPGEVRGRRLTEIDEPIRLPDALADHVPCYRIQGRMAGMRVVVWVDQGLLLVRRIEEDLPAGIGHNQTTTYDPVLNQEVAAGLLTFDPEP